MKNSNRTLVIGVVLVLVSIGLFLYPSISKQLYDDSYNDISKRFDTTTSQIQEGSFYEELESGNVDSEGYLVDESGTRTSQSPVVYKQDIDRLFKDSVAYNNELSEHQYIENGFTGAAVILSEYGIFDSVYGYVSAPAINLNLPIYLGASDENMRYGATHLMNTSLPIGGNNTNAVLAGHTNYVGKTLFDRLPSLSQGDIVTVTNYFGTIEYRVIEQKDIISTETNDIYISRNKDLLTLLTCANGGKARYIVICERVN